MRLAALIMAFMLLLSGCSFFAGDNAAEKEDSASTDAVEENAAEYPVSEFGATIDSRPGIIVSLSPSITEKLVDLGLTDRLEGISDYCETPADSVERIRLGDARSPDINAIKELSPHLILTEAELSDDDYTTLIQSGIEIAHIPRATSVDEIYAQYAGLACLLDGNRSGGALGELFCDELADKIDEISQKALTEPKNAVYLRALDFTVATGDTLEHELLALIGLNNVAINQTNWTYPEDEAKSESGKAAFESIDFIFMDERYVTMKMLEQNDFYKGLDAVKKDYYLYIDMAAFERGGLAMFDELERMAMYVNGEIPGSAG